MENIQPGVQASRNSLEFIRKIGLNTIANRFEAITPVGSSFGGYSFYGNDKLTGSSVFMKYLICPRGDVERAKFLLERDALKHLSLWPHKLAPEFFHFEEFPEFLTDVLIIEKVPGETLTNWLKKSAALPFASKLNIFHRVIFALSGATLSFQHRDFHPGNIMLLNEVDVRMGPFVHPNEIDSGVRIIDWGEALPVILGSYDDEPNHNFLMLDAAPKIIGGSFTSLPPEVFSPWERNKAFGGVYESWGVGLLLYRLIADEDPPRPASIGHYAQQIRDGSLASWICERVDEAGAAGLPGGLIIPRLLQALLSLRPENRMHLSFAGRILWDVIYEELVINDLANLESYFSNPHDYKPPSGWKFSGMADYD